MTCYFRIFVRSLAPRFPSNNQSFSDSLHAFVDYYVIYSLPLLKQQMKPSSYENKSHWHTPVGPKRFQNFLQRTKFDNWITNINISCYLPDSSSGIQEFVYEDSWN